MINDPGGDKFGLQACHPWEEVMVSVSPAVFEQINTNSLSIYSQSEYFPSVCPLCPTLVIRAHGSDPSKLSGANPVISDKLAHPS